MAQHLVGPWRKISNKKEKLFFIFLDPSWISIIRLNSPQRGYHLTVEKCWLRVGPSADSDKLYSCGLIALSGNLKNILLWIKLSQNLTLIIRRNRKNAVWHINEKRVRYLIVPTLGDNIKTLSLVYGLRKECFCHQIFSTYILLML